MKTKTRTFRFPHIDMADKAKRAELFKQAASELKDQMILNYTLIQSLADLSAIHIKFVLYENDEGACQCYDSKGNLTHEGKLDENSRMVWNNSTDTSGLCVSDTGIDDSGRDNNKTECDSGGENKN